MPDLAKCTFSLNSKPLSALVCGDQRFAAFSGRLDGVNNPEKADAVNVGPIPPGVYYIADRPSGGRLHWLEDEVHDLVSDSNRQLWFALYPFGTHDDFKVVNGTMRSNFRLHPIGRLRLSEGCITLTDAKDFDKLSALLRGQAVARIPGSAIRYYGTVEVVSDSKKP